MMNTAPLAKAQPSLIDWLQSIAEKDFENLQVKFELRLPKLGESGIIYFDSQAIFAMRTSQNYFHSYGQLETTQIPIECAKSAVTLVQI